MKKPLKMAFKAIALVASFVAISCSDISTGSDATVASGYTDATASATAKALTLNVKSDSDLIDFSSSELTEAGRMIVPAALDSTKVKFYLGGRDLVTGSDIDVQEVSFVGKTIGTGGSATTSTTEGTVTVNLEASNYRFTLVAVLSNTTVTGTALSDYVSKAVLIAYATADLRYTEEAAAVNFVLMSDGISGTGSLDLKVYLDNWSAESLALKVNDTDLVVAKATIGLYDIETGNAVASTAVTPFDLSAATSSATAISYTGGEAASSLNAGTYDLTVTFTIKSGSKYIYSDKLVILPNQKTEDTIAIPEVIELPPAAPENFEIGYIAPSYSDSDYYKVVFNWDDKSKNEQYFEIQLYDVTSDTDNITPESKNNEASWGSSTTSNTTSYSYTFYGMKTDKGPSWYAGSLNRNNEAAVFYMPLAKRYLARIRAVNQAGESAWATTQIAASDNRYSKPAATEYTIAQGLSTAENASLSSAETRNDSSTPAVIEFNTDVINLFRIRYELSGGAFEGGSKTTVYYFDQLKAGNPIMIPDGTSTVSLATGVKNTDSTIYNGGAALALKYGTGEAARTWTSWKINSISGAAYPSNYEQCSAGGDPATGTTYYTKSSTTAAADINGSTTTYGVAATQPTGTGSLTTDYYTIDGLAPYLGFSNLVLYASYSSSKFGVTIKNVADYTIEKNLKIVATVSGTGTPKLGASASDASVTVLDGSAATPVEVQYLTINRDQSTTSGGTTTTVTASNLVFTCTYTDTTETAFNYTKLQCELFQQGDKTATGTSVGVYNANSTTSGTITVPLGVQKTGTYRATFKGYTSASNLKAPYEWSVYIQLND